MPTFSVFTPSHRPEHLAACYASLAAQTDGDWEWIVLLNGKATQWSPPRPDERVRVLRAQVRGKSIGALKREACEHATGAFLVELDHDDLLASDCLAQLRATFAAHPDASLVYSDFAQIDEHGDPEHTRFDASSGWVYDEVAVDGTTQLVCRAMEPSPHNVGLIWFAPNHVRAFRREAYEEVGGYDAELDILDDQDLMIRLHLHGEFVRIPHCLYLQRWYARNTQRDPATNARIQRETVRMYDEAIEPLTLAWSERRRLSVLSLTTPTSIGGTVLQEQDAVERVLVDPTRPRIDLPDNTAGLVEAWDVLQRVPDRAAFLDECYRVLVHGGMLFTMTPSTDGRGAFQDPSHVSFWNENSFRYLTDASLRRTIPTLTSRWQVSRLMTFFPDSYYESMNVPYVRANLIAVKDGPRQGGPLLV